MPDSTPSLPDPAGPDERAALQRLRAGLIQNLVALRDQALGPLPEGQRRRLGGASKRWLLGLELMWKIEDQVLLPAVHEAAPSTEAPVRQAHQEIEILRDLAMLAQNTTPSRRMPVWRILQGMADLHLMRVGALLQAPDPSAVPWADLRQEMRQLLARWRREVQHTGDIEDEDRDPVGEPPR